MTITHVIMQTIIQSPTGLPKDRFEGTWHFQDDSGAVAADVADAAALKLVDFFQTVGAHGHNVGHYLCGSASPGDEMTIVGYDFAAARPRPELGLVKFSYATGGGSMLPEEVALCLSFFTDRNIPSHRGRSYIGPLNGSAMTGSSVPPSRPSPNLQNALTDAATRLVVAGIAGITTTITEDTFDATPSDSTAWSLYSPKLGTFNPVQHGWVDDEWDGQRRRRVEATGRVTF
jgi:hypothetical protein